MRDFNDGGPAFPGVEHALDPRTTGFVGYPGMTLRDFFAAKAMQGLLAAQVYGFNDRPSKGPFARMAYEMADAMLAAAPEPVSVSLEKSEAYIRGVSAGLHVGEELGRRESEEVTLNGGAAEQPKDGPVAWLVSSRHNGIELYDNEHDALRDFGRRCRDNDEMVGMDPLFPASAVIALQAERNALRAESEYLRERVKELEADAAMLDQMQDECWNVECEAYPIADSGDSDIEWRVFSSHMSEPRRREIGYGRTPREALNAAMQEGKS